MKNTIRTMVVYSLVTAMSFNPAAACHFCGGHGGGGYTYGPVYYGPVSSDCCHETVVYDCGDCVSCDDCDPCGDCGSCDGVVIESAPEEMMHEPAPAEAAPPTQAQPLPPQPQQPAEVERPIETAPAPQLPMMPEDPVQPAEPDNLFNGTEQPPTPPATETPAETPPATPPQELDDLFGTPAEAPAETPPAESTPPAEPADDLFGTPETTEEQPATEEAPAETPAATEGQPAETPAETPAGEEKNKAEDDIFGESRGVLREAGGLASDEMREWVDNTGNYSCRGRLVRFLDGQVQLLKDNGRTSTVPLYRLSASDLEFVHRQASAQQAEVYQTAQSQGATPLLAN